MSIEEKEKALQVSKARTAILELEYKIAKAEQDIERMREHILLQEERVKELEK